MLPKILNLASVRTLYASRDITPAALAQAVATRMAESPDRAIFITPMERDGLLRQVEALLAVAPTPNSLPLWGMPFAVKDNIDVAGLPTTAGCPAFAYTPEVDAVVVARLKAAGAIVTGKTNLDQFATGLNGTRSPYGAPRCVFDQDYISGGSSSGSAVAVASGLAAFSLGTDTAGSGRVPAALNNIVGIKPTPGRLSTTGLVPACRSLDCISVFSATVADGLEIRRIAEGPDATDPFSRIDALSDAPLRRIGVLRDADREFFGDREAAALYDASIAHLHDMELETGSFDYAPFRKTAELLYGGPWTAERLAAIEAFFASNADDIDPAVRTIVSSASRFSAVDAFLGLYRLQALRRETEQAWRDFDALLLPTTPTTYTVEAMLGDPIRLNSNLGHYTNFANLLGLAAIAVPVGFRPNGLPFGVTLVGPGSSDDALGPLADHLHRAASTGFGLDRAASIPPMPVRETPSARIPIVVVGAHMHGMPLNGELTSLGGVFVQAARTADDYKLFALKDSVPAKPGLIREPGFAGNGIEVEVWSLTPADFGRFVANVPSPLAIGAIVLEDGTTAHGFVSQKHGVAGAYDATRFGGWRAYLASLSRHEPASQPTALVDEPASASETYHIV